MAAAFVFAGLVVGLGLWVEASSEASEGRDASVVAEAAGDDANYIALDRDK